MASRLVSKSLLGRAVTSKPSLSRSLATVAPTTAATSAAPAPVASTMAAKKHTFLVIIPDVPGTIERRFENRPTHLKDIYPNVENRSLKIGGPLLNSLPKSDDATPDIYGSAVIWAADSQEEVLDILKKDVYVQKGVWDFEKVQIFPFRPTFDHQF